MVKAKRIAVVVTTLVGLVLSGCATPTYRAYSGKPRTRDQVARLDVPGSCTLLTINDKPRDAFAGLPASGTMEFLAGEYTLVFRPPASSAGKKRNEDKLTVTLLPGGTYTVNVREMVRTYHLEIKDTRTGKQVATCQHWDSYEKVQDAARDALRKMQNALQGMSL